MEESLVDLFLKADAVKAAADTRVHWASRPQGEGLPAICLFRTGGRRDANFAGMNGLVESRLQIECLAATYAEAKKLARATVALMATFPVTTSSTVFQGAFVNNERDDFDGEAPDRIFRTSVDVTLWHD